MLYAYEVPEPPAPKPVSRMESPDTVARYYITETIASRPVELLTFMCKIGKRSYQIAQYIQLYSKEDIDMKDCFIVLSMMKKIFTL